MSQRGFNSLTLPLAVLAALAVGAFYYCEATRTETRQTQGTVAIPNKAPTYASQSITSTSLQSDSSTQGESSNALPQFYSNPQSAPNGFQLASDIEYGSSTFE